MRCVHECYGPVPPGSPSRLHAVGDDVMVPGGVEFTSPHWVEVKPGTPKGKIPDVPPAWDVYPDLTDEQIRQRIWDRYQTQAPDGIRRRALISKLNLLDALAGQSGG